MDVVVFSDRDGTINKDENDYLGSKSEWKKQVLFLEGVVDGIKLINNIPDSYFFILTNQSGVALKGERFDELNLRRMHEVNKYIIEKLREQGANNYFACPYVDLTYARKARENGREVNKKYISNSHPDLKPNLGMIEQAFNSIPFRRNDCKIFMIGDRFSDVEMGVNAGGIGILVKSYKTRELSDEQKVVGLEGKTYIAESFLGAAKYIQKNI